MSVVSLRTRKRTHKRSLNLDREQYNTGRCWSAFSAAAPIAANEIGTFQMREFWPVADVAKLRMDRRLPLIRAKSSWGCAADQSSVVVVVGVLLTLICQSGCTTTRPAMKSFWQQVPPVRWPSRDSNLTTVHNEPDDEPAVAANVAEIGRAHV